MKCLWWKSAAVALLFIVTLLGKVQGEDSSVSRKKKNNQYIIAKGLAKVEKIDENLYMQPGNLFTTPIWYKYEEERWFWTPFQAKDVVNEEERWIPVSEIRVPADIQVRKGRKKHFLGNIPVNVNIKIILYLEETNPPPSSFKINSKTYNSPSYGWFGGGYSGQNEM